MQKKTTSLLIIKEVDVQKESVGNRLKTFRLSKKATQKEMAFALGCSTITYNRYERETNLPSTENLSLLYHMGCNLNWLITGEENMDIDETKYENNLIDAVNKQAGVIDKQADTIKEQAENIREYTHMIDVVISKCQNTNMKVGSGGKLYNINNNNNNKFNTED